MARLARVVLPDYPHHITQRGVRSLPIFFSNDDRYEYLRLLKEQGERFGIRFIAYCLMTNHVHLIAIPEEESSLSRGIGEAHRLYTRMINFRNRVRGYLFQGRFYSCPLDQSYLYGAVRYVENNPVRAKIVKYAWDYKWSSAAYHMGMTETDILTTDTDILKDIDNWRMFLLGTEKDLDVLRRKTRTGRPCGDSGFLAKAERITKRFLQPGKAGRPRKN